MRRNRRNLQIEESLLFSYYERPASGRAPARERLRLGPLQSDIMMPQRFGAGFPLAHWRPVYLPLMPGPVTRGLTALAVTAQAGPGGLGSHLSEGHAGVDRSGSRWPPSAANPCLVVSKSLLCRSAHNFFRLPLSYKLFLAFFSYGRQPRKF